MLVVSFIDRGNLPLPKCVVQCIINIGRRNPQAGSCVAVNDEIGLQAARLKIAANVFDLRYLL